MSLTKLTESVGRRRQNGSLIEMNESSLEINPFLIDSYRIVHSNSYKRLSDKTQVIVNPKNQHVTRRNIHTSLVSSNAVMVANILGLNEYLVRAIAEGHDVGHVPFGHQGESVFTRLTGKNFKHSEMSVFVLQEIEDLNLSWETYNGILNHSTGTKDIKLNGDFVNEYALVLFMDKISYLFQDLYDMHRAGNFLENGFFEKVIGSYSCDDPSRFVSGAVEKTISSLIMESKEKDKVSFSEGEYYEKFVDLKNKLYDGVYQKADLSYAQEALEYVVGLFERGVYELREMNPILAASLMTDKEVLALGNARNNVSNTKTLLANSGLMEIVDELVGRKTTRLGLTREEIDLSGLDYNNIDLSWKDRAYKDIHYDT